MSRNIKNSQKVIFEKIQKKMGLQDPYLEKRILFLNKEELTRFPRLKNEEILFATITHRFTIISYNNENYLIMVGEPDSIFTANIEEREITVDFWMVAIYDLDLTINSSITPNFLKEFIFPDVEEEFKNEKQNVSFYEIKKCFPFVRLFIIKDKVISYKETIYKLCINYFYTNGNCLFLKFDKDSLAAYENILNSGYDEIPLDNILRSLTTTHWRYCFLDLYRCIERLYIIARAKEYIRDFHSTHSIKEILPIIERKIQKNPQEDLALKELFSLLPSSNFDIINTCKDSNNQDNSLFYYTLRNSVVHHRKDIENRDFDDSNWNRLITFSLKTIETLYSKFNIDLKTLP